MQARNGHQKRPQLNQRAYAWKSLLCVILVALSLARSGTASATIVWSATIVGVTVDPAFGKFAFIKLSVAPTGLACGTNPNYSYTLSFDPAVNVDAQQQYALLLSAYLAGKTVAVVGKDACLEWSDTESLRGLNVIG